MTNQNLWKANRDSVWKIGPFDRIYWKDACRLFAGGGDDNPLETTDHFLSRKVGGGRLIRDCFYLLYKRNIEKRGKMPAELQMTERIIDMAQQMDGLDEIKNDTVGNKLEAALAARDLATRLSKSLPRELKNEAKSVQQAQDKLEAALEDLDALHDQLDESLQNDYDEVAEAGTRASYADEIEAMGGLIDKLEEEVELAVAQLDEAASSNQGALGLAVKDAVEEADKQLEEVLTFVKAFSLTAGGDVSEGLDLEALTFAKKAIEDCPMLNDFSEILGWGVRTMRGLWRDSLKAKANPAGIRAKTYNPQTVLQSEQTAIQGGFGKPMMVDARIRLGEEKILNFHREGGEEQEGLGDCFYLTDTSGSMSHQEVQTAFGLLFGLIEQFRKDDRQVTAMQFAGHGQYNSWTSPGKDDPADYQGLHRAITRQFTGGTEPWGPLGEALDMIIETERKADIVVLTDGYFDQPSPEFLDKLAEAQRLTSVRIFTVTSAFGHSHEASKFSDLVIPINSFYGDRQKLVELFREIV